MTIKVNHQLSATDSTEVEHDEAHERRINGRAVVSYQPVSGSNPDNVSFIRSFMSIYFGL